MAQTSFISWSTTTFTFMGSSVTTNPYVNPNMIYLTTDNAHDDDTWFTELQDNRLTWCRNVQAWMDKDLIVDEGL